MTVQKQYNCVHCNSSFSWMNHLKRHEDSIHKRIKYYCIECCQQFARREGLISHIKSRHEGVKFACNQWDYKATLQCNDAELLLSVLNIHFILVLSSKEIQNHLPSVKCKLTSSQSSKFCLLHWRALKNIEGTEEQYRQWRALKAMKIIKGLTYNEGIEYVEVFSIPPISFKPFSTPVLTHWLYPLLVTFPEASAYALAPLQFPGFSKLFTFSRI